MYFEQFYLGCLAHASYMVASDGIAAVVDPQRDVAIYIDEAAKQGFRIQHVIETHLHADFVSGHHELASRTGAAIYLGAKAQARFPHIAVSEGDEIQFGKCILRFLETPGHTPESVSILVTDLDESPNLVAVCTGDTLFIGDVGRPDLSDAYTPQELAAMLYDSLHQKLLCLPDEVKVYPAHGAGSLCGRQIGAEKSSTIGLQKRSNYACQPMEREEFVRLLTTDLPPRPEYFAKDVELNRSGAHALEELPPLPALTGQQVLEKQRAGAVVLDTRSVMQFGAAHVPGSIHIALTGQFAAWAGAIIGLDTDLVLVGEDEKAVVEARMRLARVGIERVVGFLDGGISSWPAVGALAEVSQISAWDLERMDGLQILDVRRPVECQEGTIPGAVCRPLDKNTGKVEPLDKSAPLVVHCKSGFRSSIAAGLLLRAGFTNVINLSGGYDAWKIFQANQAGAGI